MAHTMLPPALQLQIDALLTKRPINPMPERVWAVTSIYWNEIWLNATPPTDQEITELQCTTQDILYAALYLATKVEDNYIGINTFTSLTSTQPLTIRKLEVKLLEWLDFDLKRALPFLPLQGIVLRLQTAHDQKAIVEIYSRAEKCVTWVVAYNHLSELPPAKMAFAMMFYFAKKKGDVKIQRDLTAPLPDLDSLTDLLTPRIQTCPFLS